MFTGDGAPMVGRVFRFTESWTERPPAVLVSGSLGDDWGIPPPGRIGHLGVCATDSSRTIADIGAAAFWIGQPQLHRAAQAACLHTAGNAELSRGIEVMADACDVCPAPAVGYDVTGLRAAIRSTVPALSRCVSTISRLAASTRGSWRRVMCSPAVRMVNCSMSRCTGRIGHQVLPMWSSSSSCPPGRSTRSFLRSRRPGRGWCTATRCTPGRQSRRRQTAALGVCFAQIDVQGEVGRASCRERVWIPV